MHARTSKHKSRARLFIYELWIVFQVTQQVLVFIPNTKVINTNNAKKKEELLAITFCFLGIHSTAMILIFIYSTLANSVLLLGSTIQT